MEDKNKKIDEMLEVIEGICRYNGEISMYEDMVLRDIGWTLTLLKDMNKTIKEALL